MENQALNTDRELYREPDNGNGSFYSDSIHVTAQGGIGINCGGYVFVRTLREWHRLASASAIYPASFVGPVGRHSPSEECAPASDHACRQDSEGSRAIRLGATDADLELADRYADEIIELRKDNEQLQALVLELNRRLVLAGVDPRADAEPLTAEGPSRPSPEAGGRTAGLIPATGATFETFCARCGDDIIDIDHDYIIGPRAGHYCFGCTPPGEFAHVVRVAK